MRDTLIVFFFMITLAGAYFFISDNHSITPTLSPHSALSDTHSKTVSGSENIRHENGGNIYVKGKNQTNPGEDTAFREDFREDQENSSQNDEGENLYSIYHQHQDQRIKHKKTNKQANIQKAMPAKVADKVIHGVPLNAWTHSQKNRIFLPAVSPNPNAGIRVFFQCMELKNKGPKYLEPTECKSLVKHTHDRGTELSREY